jgi:hypothetical protein
MGRAGIDVGNTGASAVIVRLVMSGEGIFDSISFSAVTT